ncbi:MAG: hypothetical protein LW707_06945 [Sphingobacteriales bacterium]|nr:hypothetical protein [Sphingobacteriales bacterium]
MALIQEMERQGNWLFRYRGQIPVALFLMAIPVIYMHSGTPAPQNFRSQYTSTSGRVTEYIGNLFACQASIVPR